jgi:hypothetical protein
VRSLQTWTAGAKTDWDCVRSVVAGIQRTCRLNPTASIEATESDVVNDFLLVERRGPDYLFAIATARLLRELGFRTHVISGFYARPEGFDRASGQTAVYSDDVHFWVEVQASDQSWITIEPSPGYEVQYARLSLIETLAQRAGALLAAIWSRRITCLFGIACFVSVALYRRNIYVQVLQCWWRLPLPRTDRAVVRSALSVLDAHANLHGHQRPLDTPVEKWLRTVVQDSGEVSISLMVEFRRLVQWALYAGPEHAPTSGNPRRICRAVLDRCHNVGRSHQFNKEQ